MRGIFFHYQDWPSELMDHMLRLLGELKPCFIFKELFLQQMTDQVWTALAGTTITELRELAKMADSLHTAAQSCAMPTSFNASINPLLGAANRVAQAPPW